MASRPSFNNKTKTTESPDEDNDKSQKPPQIASETREIHSPHSDFHRPLLHSLLPLLSRSISNRFGSVQRISPIVEALEDCFGDSEPEELTRIGRQGPKYRFHLGGS